VVCEASLPRAPTRTQLLPRPAGQACLTVTHVDEAFLDLSLPIPCDEADLARRKAADSAQTGGASAGGPRRSGRLNAMPMWNCFSQCGAMGRLSKAQKKSLRKAQMRQVCVCIGGRG
jgi:hypothetical protein